MQRRLIWLFVVTVAVGGCEQLSPEMQLIHDAATALGGVEAVEATATLRIEGSGNNFRLGQNPTPNAALSARAAVESYIVEADLRNHRMRWEICERQFRRPGEHRRDRNGRRAWRSTSGRTAPGAQARGWPESATPSSTIIR